MGVNLRGGHIAMPQEILHAADVHARFQQVGGKRMAERMAGGGFRDGRSPQCLLDRPLQPVFRHMMPSSPARFPVG